MKKIKLIALFAAIIAGLAIYQFLKEISKPVEIPRTAVVVAAVNIAENTQITPEMVTMTPIANESILPGYMLDMNSVVGMVMKSDIYAGEQITSNRLVKVGEAEDQSNTLAYVIEPGMRAVTIPVDMLMSQAHMIKPGNHVDILMSYYYDLTEREEPDENKRHKEKTKYFMEDVLVLAVDQTMNKNGAGDYSTMTFQVTPEDALLLIHARQSFSFSMVLRSSLDSEPTGVPEISINTIRGIAEDKK